MRYISALVILCTGLAAGACASPQTIRYNAERHQAAANEAAARGDFSGAAREQRAADDQRAKAARRSAFLYGYAY